LNANASIIPTTNASYDLGCVSKRWGGIYASSLDVSSATVENLYIYAPYTTPVVTTNVIGEETSLAFTEYKSNSSVLGEIHRMRIALKQESGCLSLIVEKWFTDSSLNGGSAGWIYMTTLASSTI
jgi:hypothetical protein